MAWFRLTQCSKGKLLFSLCGVLFLFAVPNLVYVLDKPKHLIMHVKESIPESLLPSIPSRLGLGFSPKNPNTISQLYERSEHLSKVCTKLMKENNISQPQAKKLCPLYQNSEHKLLYCSIQKIGSSFLKRIFKVLDPSNKENRHLLDIDSIEAHIHIPESVCVSYKTARESLHSYTRFMFTRDPFSRLFSAYVDKMLVPNDYLGVMIDGIKAWRGVKAEYDDCDYYVQFPELCDFVADTILDKAPLDGHFRPIHHHCLPCLMNYTLIGKMETFMDDTRGILEIAGIDFSRVTGDLEDVDAANEVGIIQDMIARTYDKMTIRAVGCMTQLKMLQRLWRIFHIRGLVSKNYSFPQRFGDASHGIIDKDDFEKAAIFAHEQSSDRSIRLLQREESMMEAYGRVPTDILRKLALAFATDCALFDYSCDVDERFLRNYKKLNFSYFE